MSPVVVGLLLTRVGKVMNGVVSVTGVAAVHRPQPHASRDGTAGVPKTRARTGGGGRHWRLLALRHHLELAAVDTGRQKLLLLFITALLRVRPLAAAAAAACAMKRSLAALVLTTLLLELTEPLELLLDVEEAGVPAVKKPLLAPLKSLPIRSGLLRCWCDWCSCWELLW